MTEHLYLAVIAFISGIAGATVGGGGMIQLPALLNAFPGVAVPVIIGTNKLVFALSGANNVRRYLKITQFEWRILAPAMVAGTAAAVFGASLLGHLDEAWFKPVLLVLLVLIAFYTLTHKHMGENETTPKISEHAMPVAGAAGGAMFGLYQGLFGPATISFVSMALVWARGMVFVKAVGHAQLLANTCNVAALIWFLVHGQCMLEVAFLMGACSIAGSFIGLKLAERGDSRLIRHLFIAVLTLEIGRFGWSLFA